MTTTTWPDPNKPGVPLNPERDGWHEIGVRYESGTVVPHMIQWFAPKPNRFSGWFIGILGMTSFSKQVPAEGFADFEYRGPCLTPAEAQQVRVQALKEAADIARSHLKDISQLLSNPPQSHAAWRIRVEIEKLI
jgi:hypothetical protein